MTFEKSSKYIEKFKYAGSNQHGARYKKVSQRHVPSVIMSAKHDDAAGLEKLIILGDHLKVPVKYDFRTNMASIEIMSAKGM